MEIIINLMLRALSENRPALQLHMHMSNLEPEEQVLLTTCSALRMVTKYCTLSMSKYFLPYALKITGSKLIYQASRETAFFSRPLKKAAIGKRISSFSRSLWDILRPFNIVQVGFKIQEVIKTGTKKYLLSDQDVKLFQERSQE